MGKQVADNTEMQYTTTLRLKQGGGYYIETSDRANRGLIRKEYIPDGMSLVYPKEWGKTRGALVLVNHHVEVQKDIVEQASQNVEYLEKLLKGIEEIGID